MTRHRLGVVLLLPEPAATEVRGLRRAVGCPSLETQPPHLTLVPPVNVRDESLDDAVAVMRRSAAAVRGPLRLTIGPATTFSPVSPTLYLAVNGDVDGVRLLQSEIFTPPLFRRVDYDYVPHVTLHESADSLLLENGPNVLGDFSLSVAIGRVHLLVQGDDRRWTPLADVPLGPVVVRGRGGVELHLRWTTMLAPDARRLWSTFPWFEGNSAERVDSQCWLEARGPDGFVIGVRCGDDVVVAAPHLGEGIEERLLSEPERDSNRSL